MEVLTENSVLMIGVLGALAFAVSVIVEVLKEIPGIKSIPTRLIVIIVSIIVTLATLFIYAAHTEVIVLWYYVALAIFGAFVVAYISMYGWDTLRDLRNRVIK